MPCVTSMAVMSRVSQTKSSSMDIKNSEDVQESICVVCFKGVETYSIGQCDHPVCYECSTRMRVLCRQTECPICRQDMPLVVFTKIVRPFKQLKNVNQLADKKFKIYFESESIKEAYYKLLEHACTNCENKSFNSFDQLKDHVRRAHQLSFCDLCVANLKIFTFERRVYTRSELVQHRRTGDPDDKSHRGHPLCEFCDVRYMDNDELYRHLRKDHLYCHFCDADGYHRYYSNYGFLKEHFRREHFLCEEGECSEEKFTKVFRTEIDLKAHIASEHGRSMGKVELKHARTLKVEFTLAPRARGAAGPSRAGVRTQYYREEEADWQSPVEEVEQAISQQIQQIGLNTQCIEEFPCLSGNGPAPVPPSSNSSRSNSSRSTATTAARAFRTQSKPAVYETEFPALSSAAAPSSNFTASSCKPPAATIAATTQKPPQSRNSSSRHPQPTQSLSVQIRGGNISAKTNFREDFPALASPLNPIHQAIAPPGSQWAVAPKPAESKIQVVPKQQPVSSFHVKSSPSFSMDSAQFPSLGGTSQPSPPDPPESSKKTKNKNKQQKSSSAPQSIKKETKKESSSMQSLPEKPEKSKKKKKSKKDELRNGVLKETNNNVTHVVKESTTPNSNINNDHYLSETTLSHLDYSPTPPPPGFVAPPPGFNPPVVRKAPPGLPPPGFTSQSNYLPPKSFSKRNKKLLNEVVNSVGGSDYLDEFKQISGAFRSGIVSASDYIEHCTNTMGRPAFDSLFPELLALLPDISKQQELWSVAEGTVKNKLERCDICHQIVTKSDMPEHTTLHMSQIDFPPLSSQMSSQPSLFLAQDT